MTSDRAIADPFSADHTDERRPTSTKDHDSTSDSSSSQDERQRSVVDGISARSVRYDESMALTDASSVDDDAPPNLGFVDARTMSQRFLDTLDHESRKNLLWHSTRTDQGRRAGVSASRTEPAASASLRASTMSKRLHGDQLSRLARSLPLHDRPRGHAVVPRRKFQARMQPLRGGTKTE